MPAASASRYHTILANKKRHPARDLLVLGAFLKKTKAGCFRLARSNTFLVVIGVLDPREKLAQSAAYCLDWVGLSLSA